VGELIELKDRKDIKLVRMLLSKYHTQHTPPGGGGGRGNRFFAWVVDGYICAVAWLHDNTPFRYIAQMYRIGSENTYFIRRVCKTCPGDHLVDFLNALSDKLRNEGKECLWTLGMDDHSNALYKRAAFVEVGVTPRTKNPVFVKRLR
jgi:hypothetical protein